VSNRCLSLLRWSLGFVWIYTGVLCLAVLPIEETEQLTERIGLNKTAGRWIVWLTSAFEIALGLAVAAGVWQRTLAHIQLVLITGFTVLISIFLPEFWLHPFGPISKNVVLLAAAFVTGYGAR
jgi:uncharacterized membrane protein YphA (DoxX/SURF4 family)